MAEFPPDFDEGTVELCRAVKPFTMTSKYAIYALRLAVRYVVQNRIGGDIVECGVWKGGEHDGGGADADGDEKCGSDAAFV